MHTGSQVEAATLTEPYLSVEPGCECNDRKSRQVLYHEYHADNLCASKIGPTKTFLVGQVVCAAFGHLLLGLVGMLHHRYSTVNIEPKISARQPA